MRDVASRIDRRLERLAVASAHHRDAITRLDMRSAEHRAAFETFVAAMTAEPAADTIQLGDARTEMERLRRRLGMRFEEPVAQPPADDEATPNPQRGAL